MSKNQPVPRPLVRTNQWFIVLSVLFAWVFGMHWVLALPWAVGVMSLGLHFNPVMKTAKLFLRKQPSEYVLEDAAQLRFNQWIAVACLSMSLAAFWLGIEAAGFVLSALVALAALIANMRFCVGCFIRYQWSQYRYRRSVRHSG